jgi:hypothetical protein
MEDDLNNDMEEAQEKIEEFNTEKEDDLIDCRKKQGRDRVYSSSGLINP